MRKRDVPRACTLPWRGGPSPPHLSLKLFSKQTHHQYNLLFGNTLQFDLLVQMRPP